MIEGAGRAPRRRGAATPRSASGAAQPAPGAPAVVRRQLERLHQLQWLHIPKTGTSFIATIWNYACGQEGLPLDLYVDAWYTAACGNCYDFAVMDRYPKRIYCDPGVLSSRFQTQHRPLEQEWFSADNVVGFFRRPSQRLISGHRDKLHASGFTERVKKRLVESCMTRGAGCYARFPGIAGCSARMLAGSTCADASAIDDPRWDHGQSYVDTAVTNVARLQFVGVTEDWDESVCLFHRMFGGRVNPAEFKDFHSHPGKHGDYDEAELDGFVDAADELVYAAAARRHSALRARYVDGESACEGIVARAGADGGGASRADALSCGARGVQCGHLEGLLDCGECPRHRAPPGTAPACTAGGVCTVEGRNMSERFAWYVD
ncbi:unnamed protein product [Prorocentrum cordatum]|uniref:Sulfotransferase n=1 Tax=Prorocentrum cordatum TaxID=2364126 RepID=A0ABN9QUE9_9DINO|nr:unnamed protein product [Polarella glacialis]